MSNIVLPKNWDPVVKLTHWGGVGAVIANALFTEEGSGWHIWVGYALAGLLLLRWLWGLVGTRNARFSAFPPNPVRALRYIANARKGAVEQHASHNPVGSLMVYALWGCLAVILASGIAMSGPPPANPNVRESGERHEAVMAGTGVASANEGDEEGGYDHDEASEKSGGGDEEILEEIHEIAVNLLYVLILLHISGVLFETMRHGRGTLGAMIPFMNRRTP